MLQATKLTLRLDKHLITSAKKIARKRGESLSQIVAKYFALLEAESEKISTTKLEISPTIRSLKGILRGKKVSKADYRKYLGKK